MAVTIFKTIFATYFWTDCIVVSTAFTFTTIPIKTTSSRNTKAASTINSKLFGIAEWRDDVPTMQQQKQSVSPTDILVITSPTPPPSFMTDETTSFGLIPSSFDEPSFMIPPTADNNAYDPMLIQHQTVGAQQQLISGAMSTATTTTTTTTTTDRTVPLLILPSEQVTVIGETKYFHFVTDEEVRLFQQSIDHHHGVFGVGYVTTDDFASVIVDEDDHDGGDDDIYSPNHLEGGRASASMSESKQIELHHHHHQHSHEGPDEVLLDRLTLMEILNYRYMDNVDMGIICTAQTVGRASLKKVEVVDKSSSSFSRSLSSASTHIDHNDHDDYNYLAGVCTEYFDEIEDLYNLREANKMAHNVTNLIAEICEVEQQQQHGQYFDEHNDEDDEEEQDEEQETRSDRFCKAIRDAYESDCHGYHIMPQIDLRTSIPSEDIQPQLALKSWKELNAVSWAAYSSSINVQWDETYRLHALDMNSITNRLKLAEFWLSDKLLETKAEFCFDG